MAQIRITPEELYQGANAVNGLAQAILDNLTQLKSTVDGVANNWEGAARSSYVESFNQLHAEFVKTFPPAVEGMASQMNSAAQTIEQTDAELSKAFASK